MADLFPNRTLYLTSILIFLAGSVLAGMAHSMLALTVFRAVQGIGAGGNFALVYIVLSDISEPENRGRMMSYASFVWGLASVLGPSLGGFIVNWVSWRWIFYINVPIGLLSLAGIWFFLIETREKRQVIEIDYAGILTLVVAILAFLTAFLLGGRTYAWTSPPIVGLFMLFFLSATGFYMAERRSREPIFCFEFFRRRGFTTGNGLVFFSSVAIFSLSAFSPLFIQGALGQSPFELGLVMVALSFGWSGGALVLRPAGQSLGGETLFHHRRRDPDPRLHHGGAFFGVHQPVDLCPGHRAGRRGHGVHVHRHPVDRSEQRRQERSGGCHLIPSVYPHTRRHRRYRHLRLSGHGPIARVADSLGTTTLKGTIAPGIMDQIRQNFENFFRPDVQQQLTDVARGVLHQAIGHCVIDVFWLALVAAVVCLVWGLYLPRKEHPSAPAASPSSEKA